jgi:4-diphosphocytidyl-2C-methyl-D-erythritol kinase
MGNKQAKAQKKQGQQAARQAEDAQRQQDREFNRLNQKSPNIASTMKRNRTAGQSGVAGTYLTGSGGAATTPGMLGSSKLLGS